MSLWLGFSSLLLVSITSAHMVVSVNGPKFHILVIHSLPTPSLKNKGPESDTENAHAHKSLLHCFLCLCPGTNRENFIQIKVNCNHACPFNEVLHKLVPVCLSEEGNENPGVLHSSLSFTGALFSIFSFSHNY